MDEELYEIDDKVDFSVFKGITYDHFLKMVVVGNTSTGKSQIIQRLTENSFDSLYLSTLGFMLSEAMYYKINNKIIKYMIWDCSGDDIYRDLITSIFVRSLAFVCVYSIDK